MTITQMPSSVLGMGRDLVSSGFRNVTWLGKEVGPALNGGLSRAASITASIWSATSPHLASLARATTTPQGLLVCAAILVTGAIIYRSGILQCIFSRIQGIFSNTQQNARSEEGTSTLVAEYVTILNLDIRAELTGEKIEFERIPSSNPTSESSPVSAPVILSTVETVAPLLTGNPSTSQQETPNISSPRSPSEISESNTLAAARAATANLELLVTQLEQRQILIEQIKSDLKDTKQNSLRLARTVNSLKLEAFFMQQKQEQFNLKLRETEQFKLHLALTGKIPPFPAQEDTKASEPNTSKVKQMTNRPRQRPHRKTRDDRLMGKKTREKKVYPVPPETAEWYSLNPLRK